MINTISPIRSPNAVHSSHHVNRRQKAKQKHDQQIATLQTLTGPAHLSLNDIDKRSYDLKNRAFTKKFDDNIEHSVRTINGWLDTVKRTNKSYQASYSKASELQDFKQKHENQLKDYEEVTALAKRALALIDSYSQGFKNVVASDSFHTSIIKQTYEGRIVDCVSSFTGQIFAPFIKTKWESYGIQHRWNDIEKMHEFKRESIKHLLSSEKIAVTESNESGKKKLDLGDQFKQISEQLTQFKEENLVFNTVLENADALELSHYHLYTTGKFENIFSNLEELAFDSEMTRDDLLIQLRKIKDDRLETISRQKKTNIGVVLTELKDEETRIARSWNYLELRFGEVDKSFTVREEILANLKSTEKKKQDSTNKTDEVVESSQSIEKRAKETAKQKVRVAKPLSDIQQKSIQLLDKIVSFKDISKQSYNLWNTFTDEQKLAVHTKELHAYNELVQLKDTYYQEMVVGKTKEFGEEIADYQAQARLLDNRHEDIAKAMKKLEGLFAARQEWSILHPSDKEEKVQAS